MTGVDATFLRDASRAGTQSLQETLDGVFGAVARHDGELCAMASLDEAGARRRAEELEAKRARGEELGALFGVPIVVKSNLCVAGWETHCGSRLLEGYRPPYDATVIRHAREADALLIGNAHMDEFAMGSSGENSGYATTQNPWDPGRAPGGSSSGSAVAVSAGYVPLALGSDTGGSVRQPASFCGIAGFKPSYGRLSRFGLVAYGSSLDQVGPLATGVRDLELALAALAPGGARDPLDATSVGSPGCGAPSELAGLRLGVHREAYAGAGVDACVRERFEEALELLRASGAELVELTLATSELAIPAYYVIATAEASTNLARFEGVRYGRRHGGEGSLAEMMSQTRAEGFGAEVKRRILLGTYALSEGYREAWYRKALDTRAAMAAEYERAFESLDAIVSPTSPTAAFELGARTRDPLAMYAADVMTVPANLAGLPAVSVPCGTVREGGSELPVGLQFMSRRGADERCLAVARLYEEARGVPWQAPEGFTRAGVESEGGQR